MIRKIVTFIAIVWALGCSNPTGDDSGGESGTDTYVDTDSDGDTDTIDDGEEAASSLLDSKTATFIPSSTNLDFVDPDGEPLVVDTKIHDVRFCVGDKRTDEVGGISDKLVSPVSKELNGVEFYEENLLLSGVGFHGEDRSAGTDNPYYHYVYGRRDASGQDMGLSPKHPRNNLAYLPLMVLYPKGEWNGRLIVYVHGAGEYLSRMRTPYDEIYLLSKGYAVASYSHFFEINDQQNPNAADGSYFASYFDFGDRKYLAHNALIGKDGSEERVPKEYDEDVLMTVDTTTARNITNLVKNLLNKRFSKYPEYTYGMFYSYSGKLVAALNGARDTAIIDGEDHPEMLVDGLTPFTGGNFDVNDWTGIDTGINGQSLGDNYGLVFDGFYVNAGYLDYPDASQYKKDPIYPISTKTVNVDGDFDMSYMGLGSILEAVNVARTLPNAHPSINRDLNSWKRIYHITRIGHRRYGFEEGLNGSSLIYFDRSVLFDSKGYYIWFSGADEALNEEGTGLRFRWVEEKLYTYAYDGFIEHGLHGDPVSDIGYFGYAEYMVCQPRTYAIRSQLFDNLTRWVELGEEPPESHMDDHIMSNPNILPGEEIEPGVWSGIPECPELCPMEDEDVCPLADCYYPGRDFPEYLEDVYRDAIQYFVDEAVLNYSLGSISSPDLTARIGTYIPLDISKTWMKPFRNGKLKELYEDHDGYVDAVRDACDALVAEKLMDPVLGQRFIEDAMDSNILIISE